jgi:hypothetical protein
MTAQSITGIVTGSDARRFLVLASFSLRSVGRAPRLAGVVQAVRSAAVLTKASPKRRTWRAGVQATPLSVRSEPTLFAKNRAPLRAKIWPDGTQHGSVARVSKRLNVANGA